MAWSGRSGRRGSLAYYLLLLSSSISALGATSLPLTYEKRVQAQEAIERVYHGRRTWPEQNPQPKPSFEQMVPRAVIEAKVTDYLKKSAALDKYWKRPLRPEQLQAEMERMAKWTRDPATLHELFTALDDDPYLIAECLARPILADRLMRNWYAQDEHSCEEAAGRGQESSVSSHEIAVDQPPSAKEDFEAWWSDVEPKLGRDLPEGPEAGGMIFSLPLLSPETSCQEWQTSSLTFPGARTLDTTILLSGREPR